VTNHHPPAQTRLTTALPARIIDTAAQAVSLPRAGDPCPICRQGSLDYDGLLNLSCPACGQVFGDGGGCTR